MIAFIEHSRMPTLKRWRTHYWLPGIRVGADGGGREVDVFTQDNIRDPREDPCENPAVS